MSNPTGVEEYHNSSRLHFLGTWRTRYKDYLSRVRRSGGMSFFEGEIKPELKAVLAEFRSATREVHGSSACTCPKAHTESQMWLFLDMDCFFVSVATSMELVRLDSVGFAAPEASSTCEVNDWEVKSASQSGVMTEGQKNMSQINSAGSASSIKLSEFLRSCDSSQTGLSLDMNGAAVVASGQGSGSEVCSANYAARALGITAGMYLQSISSIIEESDVRVISVDSSLLSRCEVVWKQVTCILSTLFGLGNVSGLSCDEGIVRIPSEYCQCSISKVASATLDIRDEVVGVEGGGSKPSTSIALPPLAMLAQVVRSAVYQATGCPCSVGISPARLVSKIAASSAKPNGFKTLGTRWDVACFMYMQKISCLPGVGSSTEEKLAGLGIFYCRDVPSVPEAKVAAVVGQKTAKKLALNAVGLDLTEGRESEGRLGKVGDRPDRADDRLAGAALCRGSDDEPASHRDDPDQPSQDKDFLGSTPDDPVFTSLSSEKNFGIRDMTVESLRLMLVALIGSAIQRAPKTPCVVRNLAVKLLIAVPKWQSPVKKGGCGSCFEWSKRKKVEYDKSGSDLISFGGSSSSTGSSSSGSSNTGSSSSGSSSALPSCKDPLEADEEELSQTQPDHESLIGRSINRMVTELLSMGLESPYDMNRIRGVGIQMRLMRLDAYKRELEGTEHADGGADEKPFDPEAEKYRSLGDWISSVKGPADLETLSAVQKVSGSSCSDRTGTVPLGPVKREAKVVAKKEDRESDKKRRLDEMWTSEAAKSHRTDSHRHQGEAIELSDDDSIEGERLDLKNEGEVLDFKYEGESYHDEYKVQPGEISSSPQREVRVSEGAICRDVTVPCGICRKSVHAGRLFSHTKLHFEQLEDGEEVYATNLYACPICGLDVQLSDIGARTHECSVNYSKLSTFFI